MNKQLPPWRVIGLRTNRGYALLGSTLITTPTALVGCWLFASWANVARHSEDHQMIILLGGALPFTAACVILNLLMHRKLYHRPTPTKLIIRTSLLALILAWPMMVLSVMLTNSLPLPMVDERTPAIITLWTILVLGWGLLTLICTTIFGLSIGVEQLHQRTTSCS